MDAGRKNLHYFMLLMTPQRIPEGFRGQRLVVLPSQVREGVKQHPLLRGLLVTDAGIFPRAASHFIQRERGAVTTLLIACLSGKGWVKFGEGTPVEVTPGMLVWLSATHPHSYGAAENDPWTIEWVHYQGDEVDSWKEMLRLPSEGGILRHSPASLAELRLGQVWAHLDNGYAVQNLAAASAALRSALAATVHLQAIGSGQKSSQERVMDSMEWMKQRLQEPLRLAELAAFAGLSVPHYTVLFRQYSGFTPIDWFNRLRIMKACEMLDITQMAVSEIARQTGFSDPYYFTRCFKRVVGHSPRKYRKIPKG